MTARPRGHSTFRVLTDFFSKRRLSSFESVPPFLQVVIWSPVADMTAATTKLVLSISLFLSSTTFLLLGRYIREHSRVCRAEGI